MTIGIQDWGAVVEIAGAAIGVGVAGKHYFDKYIIRHTVSSVTKKDIEEMIVEMTGKNGSTVLTKDMHAQICSGNLLPIKMDMARIRVALENGENHFASIDRNLSGLADEYHKGHKELAEGLAFIRGRMEKRQR